MSMQRKVLQAVNENSPIKASDLTRLIRGDRGKREDAIRVLLANGLIRERRAKSPGQQRGPAPLWYCAQDDPVLSEPASGDVVTSTCQDRAPQDNELTQLEEIFGTTSSPKVRQMLITTRKEESYTVETLIQRDAATGEVVRREITGWQTLWPAIVEEARKRAEDKMSLEEFLGNRIWDNPPSSQTQEELAREIQEMRQAIRESDHSAALEPQARIQERDPVTGRLLPECLEAEHRRVRARWLVIQRPDSHRP